jgi:hypothetical protein
MIDTVLHWTAFKHNVVGECACGIKTHMCDYHRNVVLDELPELHWSPFFHKDFGVIERLRGVDCARIRVANEAALVDWMIGQSGKLDWYVIEEARLGHRYVAIVDSNVEGSARIFRCKGPWIIRIP